MALPRTYAGEGTRNPVSALLRVSAVQFSFRRRTLAVMRMIGTVASEVEAERFTAYLLTLKIDAFAEKSDASDAWLVWIEHDDLIDRGREELAAFTAAPGDPKYAVVSDANRIRREKQKAAERRQKNFTDVRTNWSGARRFATPVTLALVGLCVLTFLAVQGRDGMNRRVFSALLFQPPQISIDESGQPAGDFGAMIQSHEKSGWSLGTDAVRHGQIWRLFSPMLLHYGLGHIFFNMLWLLSMGGRLEARKGPLMMILVVLIGALVAHCGQAAWEIYRTPAPGAGAVGHDLFLFGVGFGGMSGVNYAIFGFLWIYGRLRPSDGLVLQPQDIGLALGWLVLCMTPLIPNVANAAHVMGLVAGVAMAWVYVRGLRGPRRT